MSENSRHQLLLTLVCAAMFLTKLGGTQLWDDDETFFAQCAVEMQSRGDLAVPYFNGEVFVHKPPIMYWGMIAAFKVFGVNEFAVRLPSAIFGWLTVLLVYHIGRRLFSAKAGFWAGAALATCLNFAVIARAGVTDGELTFFISLPLWFFIRGTEVRAVKSENDGGGAGSWSLGELNLKPSWSTYALCYAAMGLAAMVKGPIGILLPTCVLGLFLLIIQLPQPAADQSRWRTVWTTTYRLLSPWRFLKTCWQMRPLTAVAAILVVAGPWYAWVSVVTCGEWPAGFFGIHHFGRFTTVLEGHAGSPLYYPAAICVGFFPWIVLIGPALGLMISCWRLRDPWRPGYVLAFAWAAVWIGFFTISGTKLPHYVIPAYPAIALVTGAFVDRWIRGAVVYKAAMQRAAWGTIFVVGLVLAIALPILLHKFLGGDEIVGLVGLPLLIGAVVGLMYSRRAQFQTAAATLLVTSLIFGVAILGFAAERIDRHQTSRAWASWVWEQSGGQPPVLGEWGYFRPSILYYANRPVKSCWYPAHVKKFFAENQQRAFLFTTVEEYSQMRESLPPDVKILERKSRFPKSGEVLLLGREEPRVVETIAKRPGGEIRQVRGTTREQR